MGNKINNGNINMLDEIYEFEGTNYSTNVNKDNISLNTAIKEFKKYYQTGSSPEKEEEKLPKEYLGEWIIDNTSPLAKEYNYLLDNLNLEVGEEDGEYFIKIKREVDGNKKELIFKPSEEMKKDQ